MLPFFKRQALMALSLAIVLPSALSLTVAAQEGPAAELAYHYLAQAADAGDADSAFQVALAHTFGNGAPRDLVKRKKYLDIAVAKDHPQALYYRALDYQYGSDLIAKDEAKSLTCLKRSAKLGFVGAQNSLGFNFETGDLVGAIDLVRSSAWYSLSIRTAKADPRYGEAPGSEPISSLEEFRDAVNAQLSPDQITAADALSYTLLEDIKL
ncbi:sel1 repeat family protein [Asticcacaulis biprosthecium C19]|uniref:Sel1 repeat family protein n=1 Tax=Asticcacaulis biprosthecium C19 TaxID=715226 RepID=F4QU74_9CAUL|nr:sel1 repeat family protein [Asticcacaulis biprosthecium]EGF89374.1 sel1 repeat family protein [Asticcacaulis biprosthecium C19]